MPILTQSATVLSAHPFDGSGIDGTWFVDASRLMERVPWLGPWVATFSEVALVALALLVALAWWRARDGDLRARTATLVAPFAVLLTLLLTQVVKQGVQENRPCQSLPAAFRVQTCPTGHDWSFPSAHTALAFACVGALWVVDRRLASVALVLALAEAVSRVFVGAHYPHDVLAGAALGLVLGGLVTARGRDRWAGSALASRVDAWVGFPVPGGARRHPGSGPGPDQSVSRSGPEFPGQPATTRSSPPGSTR